MKLNEIVDDNVLTEESDNWKTTVYPVDDDPEIIMVGTKEKAKQAAEEQLDFLHGIYVVDADYKMDVKRSNGKIIVFVSQTPYKKWEHVQTIEVSPVEQHDS